LIFSASTPTVASCSASLKRIGLLEVGLALDRQRFMGVGEQVDRIIGRNDRRLVHALWHTEMAATAILNYKSLVTAKNGGLTAKLNED